MKAKMMVEENESGDFDLTMEVVSVRENVEPEEFREILIDTLKLNKVQVVFEKLDGSERIMNCTLIQEFLPEPKPPKPGAKKKPENLEVVAVFDLEAEGWRSFRLDSIKSVAVSDIDDEEI
jgi:hypothetical protein